MFLAQKLLRKAKTFQWIIMSLLIWSLIALPIYCINHYYSRDVAPYNLINSYLDYRFGFVKRGLFAEIISFVNINHTDFLFVMTYLIGFVLISTITYQFKEKLNTKNDFLIYILIILNPLFIKNYVFNAGSSDILFCLYLLIIVISNHRISKVFMLVYPFMVFIHEAISIMFLPAVIYIYSVRFHHSECTKKIAFFTIFLSVTFSLFVFKYSAVNTILEEVYNYVLIEKQYLSSATKSITSDDDLKFILSKFFYSMQDHIKMVWSYENIVNILKKIHIFIIIYFINKYMIDTVFKIIREYYKIPYILCLLSSGFFVSIICALDTSRFIAMMFSIFVICGMATNKELFFTTLKEKFYQNHELIRFFIIITYIIHPHFGIYLPFFML